jgi:anti-anti-sigma regulatory factor
MTSGDCALGVLVIDERILLVSLFDLQDHLDARLETQPPGTIGCDVGALTHPDLHTIDALAQMQRVAKERGCSIALCNARPPLVDLIALSGLSSALPICG